MRIGGRSRGYRLVREEPDDQTNTFCRSRYEPEQPFRANFSRRAYQGFPPDRREELAKRFLRWLHPRGTACVEMINVIRDSKPFKGPFRAAGFREMQQRSQRGDVFIPSIMRRSPSKQLLHPTGPKDSKNEGCTIARDSWEVCDEPMCRGRRWAQCSRFG